MSHIQGDSIQIQGDPGDSDDSGHSGDPAVPGYRGVFFLIFPIDSRLESGFRGRRLWPGRARCYLAAGQLKCLNEPLKALMANKPW